MTQRTDTDHLFATQRAKIDSLNERLIELLAERQQICLDVGRIKAQQDIPVMQQNRVEAILQNCAVLAAHHNLRPHYIRRLFQHIIHEACELEEQLSASSSKIDTLVTLGPAGTNHELIANEYLSDTGLNAKVLLVDSFDSALHEWRQRRAQMILICAAHPAYAELIGTCVTQPDLQPVDSFIRRSQSLAVLTANSISTPQSIALHPATRNYTDLSAWKEIIEVQSTVAAVQGVRAGRWHSAIGPAASASNSSMRIEREIGAPADVWVILK